MKKIEEVKNGNKLVKALELEFGTRRKYGDYYYVQHNWPEETCFMKWLVLLAEKKLQV